MSYRYRTLCFWLFAKPEILKPRLDARVDQMVQVWHLGLPLSSYFVIFFAVARPIVRNPGIERNSI